MSMRSSLVLVLFAAIGCSSDPDSGPESKLAFTVTSSDLTLQPGEETTKCFYFHTPNTEQAIVNKWVSDMTAGSHHMIVFASLDGMQPPDGTLDDCSGGNIPVPMFGTQIPHEELVMPDDDGFGVPLAQVVEPNTAAYFQMHYLNSSDEPMQVHVTLSAYALPAATMYTRTDIFATYNADISIPPGATNHVVTATCDIFDKKFWQMSSHSHKQSRKTEVKDGASMIFDSTDWEHPGTRDWTAPTFYQFQNTQMTWSCTYDNTGDNASRTVTDGQSAQTDEMCMMTGYYFPAAGARGCFMSGGQCRCLL
jgi:hypothetical protein